METKNVRQSSRSQRSQMDNRGNRNYGSNRKDNSNGGGFSFLKILGAVAGGALLYKGTTGKWPFLGGGKDSQNKNKEIEIHSRLTINKPKSELYAYWRNLENLPNIMSHIERVTEMDNKRSHWTAEVPGGLGTIDWDAEIIQEEPDHLLAWESVPNADIENSGEVRFEDAPGGGSVVETTIYYRPPAGEIGGMTAKLFNPAFEKTIKQDLKDFKKFMEKGGSQKGKNKAGSRM